MTETEKNLAVAEFELWWFNHGSGMPPEKDEEASEHVHRITRIAWLKAWAWPKRDAE